jgi:hypothetical protein
MEAFTKLRELCKSNLRCMCSIFIILCCVINCFVNVKILQEVLAKVTDFCKNLTVSFGGLYVSFRR